MGLLCECESEHTPNHEQCENSKKWTEQALNLLEDDEDCMQKDTSANEEVTVEEYGINEEQFRVMVAKNIRDYKDN